METDKKRKAYYEIIEYIKVGRIKMILLFGLRQTGKSHILRQLATELNTEVIDFRKSTDSNADYLKALRSDSKYILLDEIGYLEGFDLCMDSYAVDIIDKGKTAVITSSSYQVLRQLAQENLGAGRSVEIVLPPLTFEEYLYFSNKIPEYGHNYAPTNSDLEAYYRLDGIPEKMDFVINRSYLSGIFTDAKIAENNIMFADRSLYMNESEYEAVLDILCYTLNKQFRSVVFGRTKVGVQEFGVKGADDLNLSESLIHYANSNTSNLVPKSIANIIAVLYRSGFLFIDLKKTHDTCELSDNAISDLLAVKTESCLRSVLKNYVFSPVSPLLYTRLLADLEDNAHRIYSNSTLKGRLYELAIKAEDIAQSGYMVFPRSYMFKDVDTDKEVDLISKHLFLEATVETKDDGKFIVDSIMPEKKAIRVLTDVEGVFEDNAHYIRMAYPSALLALSSGRIYELPAKIGDIFKSSNCF